MKQMLSITAKELKAYFGSPMAAIFIGTFLLVTLFSFFWVDTFFARNIADIRPLFRWMPVLMIFLSAALTMRQWSEEQRMGTLEILLTLPVRIRHLVLGKFLAVLALVGLALVLTLGLPVTVSFLGDLDWGPVAGGYLAALLMASAYIAIGLFVSSRTDNQLIALILTVLLCGLLYVVGSSGVTDFLGTRGAELFRALGTGSRFQSIERGVVDLRDLVYYGSLCIFFLSLNTVSLDRKRWSGGESTAGYRRNALAATVLVAANLLALNLWLARATPVRLDLTESREYSISPTTRDLLANLQEPLLLRGYFSEKTHPLLAPLVPRIRDMLTEYGIASGGTVTVDFVDPRFDEELEADANQQYGIKPVPFQVAGRYEASVVNSYFNILIKYGDQYAILGFEDLIEIERRKDGELEVRLRNLEYDLTKSIKKAVYGFQSLGSLFAGLDQELRLTAFITADTLPETLSEVPARIAKVAGELEKESLGKLHFSVVDPDRPGAPVTRQELAARYDFRPFSVSLFGGDTFFLHLLLGKGAAEERVYLSGEMTETEIRNDLEAALKRSSSGFLKTVGFWSPPPEPPQYQEAQPAGPTFQLLQERLRENYNVKPVDLAKGTVLGEIDILLLAAPQGLSELERYAVDQYLMRGGAVVALAGNYLLDLQPYSRTLALKKVEGGLTELLGSYGIKVEDTLVLDEQNEPFPIPVSRDLGGFVIQEIQRINYPFFVDVRESGMDAESPVVANLPAVTLNWVSPITVDPARTGDLKVSRLLSSSPRSWPETTTEIQPDFERYPDFGFAVGDQKGGLTLAVALKGSFSSYFSDKPAPAPAPAPAPEDGPEKADESGKSGAPTLPPTIRKSPDSSRLVAVGSSEFVNDAIMRITQGLGQERFLNSLELVQNAVDWSVEDEDLLAIRSRGSHARILEPMSRRTQSFWEGLNYGIALLALACISIYGAIRRRREEPMEMV